MTTNKEIETIKEVVREVLEENPKCRNSDKFLILQTLRKMGFKIYIDYNDLDNIPSFETITRCRRFIQNKEGKYIPNKQVDKMRNRRQQENKIIFRGSHLYF